MGRLASPEQQMRKGCTQEVFPKCLLRLDLASLGSVQTPLMPQILQL